MAPSEELSNGDLEAAKKRKRDGIEDREDRKARKRRRSKAKKQRGGGKADPASGPPQDVVALPGDGGPADPEGARAPSWRVSKPLGGRMLDIDPIFSVDEEHLIVIYNTSIQIYSTADSLLVRRIPLLLSSADTAAAAEPSNEGSSAGAHIVAAGLSKASPDLVWVAGSDGRIWCIDWTTGAGAETPFTLRVKRILDMAVDQARADKTGTAVEDAILVLEKTSHSGGHVVAYDRGSLESKQGMVLYACDDNPHLLRTYGDAAVVLVATKNSIHAGVHKKPAAKDAKAAKGDKGPGGLSQYQFFSFGVEDQVTTIDARLADEPFGGSKGKPAARPAVDLAIGCARGAILVLTDLLDRFAPAGTEAATARKSPPQPRKLHWHPRAVHSVKWSRDGNYLISGGSETVLVLWQLDTGKKNFLPHLSASIENIAVSPRGSSYAVHLDDNSAMVLSTSEMKPTTYVSGVQSFVFSDGRPKDSMVQRVWQEPEEISTSIPAASSPLNPSHLLISTGHGQKSTLADGKSLSAPYLQVFDLESSQSVSKQAVARANPTESAITSRGHPILEPTVTRMAFSHDGAWLATVDEWQPPERDLEPLLDGSSSAADVARGRREVYLKFWEADPSGASFQLASRINDAHYTSDPEPILGLASDSTSARFATVGADGCARIWAPRPWQTDGIAAAGPKGEHLWRWTCAQSVALERAAGTGGDDDDIAGERGGDRRAVVSGAVDFSEDGSTLFVAYGRGSDAVLYILDAESGRIRDRLLGMFNGGVKDVKTVSSCVVLLSDDLKVYNVVSDELRYGVSLKKWYRGAFPLVQLAANRRSQSFALAIPLGGAKREGRAKKGDVSELVVFSLDDNKPRLTQSLPHLVTALVPAGSGSGFVAVDSAAHVWSVSLGSEVNRLAQPLADIQLDQDEGGDEKAVVERPQTDIDDDDAASDEEMQDIGADEVEAEDLDTYPAVIAPQRLAEVFNAGPAFAMPPIEDVFYQVAELLAPKPNPIAAGAF